MSCSQRPFLPVNVGREDGNPKTPIVITHLSKQNSWMVKRVKHGHNIFQRILCFRYVCRVQVGRNKPKKGLSKKEFAQVIERNRERGFYDSVAPIQKPAKAKSASKKDTVILSDTLTVVDVTPTMPKPRVDSLITLNEFLFETNSYKLKAEHLPELDALGEYLRERPTLELTISGHTDNTGNENHNLNLSTRRAESVAEYLVNKGVDDARIMFKGLGSAQPIAGNDTAEGRSKNRRVEILIHHPKR